MSIIIIIVVFFIYLITWLRDVSSNKSSVFLWLAFVCCWSVMSIAVIIANIIINITSSGKSVIVFFQYDYYKYYYCGLLFILL